MCTTSQFWATLWRRLWRRYSTDEASTRRGSFPSSSSLGMISTLDTILWLVIRLPPSITHQSHDFRNHLIVLTQWETYTCKCRMDPSVGSDQEGFINNSSVFRNALRSQFRSSEHFQTFHNRLDRYWNVQITYNKLNQPIRIPENLFLTQNQICEIFNISQI